MHKIGDFSGLAMVKKPSFLLLVPLLFLWCGCDGNQKQSNASSYLKETKKVDNLSSGSSFIRELTPEAIEIVRQGLKDSRAAVRTNAIEIVALGDRLELMNDVVALLGDGFVPVRFAAALAVGDLRYEPGREAVKQLLKDDDENVRIAAAYAMTRLEQGNYDDYFRKAVKSKNQTVRANAALILGKLGDKQWLPALYWIIRAPDSEDKALYQAAEAIAMLGDENIYEKLWTMLISTYPDVRVTGIRAMGALGNVEAKNALITLLDDEVLEVRLDAARQLGAMGDKSGESVVLEFLRNPPADLDEKGIEHANVFAALAIGQIGTSPLTKFLPKFLTSESETVRLVAAKAVLILAK